MLANKVKKSAAAAEGEEAATFIISIFVITVILGLVLYPAQVISIFQGILTSFGAPFIAVLSGIYNLFVGLISGIVNAVTSGVSNGLSWIGNGISSGLHYIGLYAGGGTFP
jgi:hypothetical protein|nr:hypothetical protein [Ferrimicrobium acidiphilum]